MSSASRVVLNTIVPASEQPMFTVVGTLLQFVSTPEQNRANLSVMRGGIPAGAVVPLHSHASPEIFYVLEGMLDVFQDEGKSSEWKTATVGDVVTVAGGVKHALRNPGSTLVMTILISDEQLYRFFQELAEPLDPASGPPPPSPAIMQKLFEVAARYNYWIGSPAENASIGIQVG
jgi:quercetin dioxygenase-like cupin family protein